MKELILRTDEPGTDFLTFPWVEISVKTVDRGQKAIMEFLAPIHEDAIQPVLEMIEDFYRRRLEEMRELEKLNGEGKK